MPKTISIPDKVFNRMRRYGVSGQSYGDLINDLLDFVDDNEEAFDEFLDELYGGDEEDE